MIRGRRESSGSSARHRAAESNNLSKPILGMEDPRRVLSISEDPTGFWETPGGFSGMPEEGRDGGGGEADCSTLPIFRRIIVEDYPEGVDDSLEIAGDSVRGREGGREGGVWGWGWRKLGEDS